MICNIRDVINNLLTSYSQFTDIQYFMKIFIDFKFLFTHIDYVLW